MYFLGLIIIVGIIIFFISRRKRKDNEQYLQIMLSKEDALSELFLFLSILFLGVTLLAFNNDFGDPFSWRLILFIVSVLGLISAYYFKIIFTLIFSLIGIASWWGVQALEWIDGKDIKTSSIYAGLIFLILLFYVIGNLHEKEIKFKRFSLVYLILGIIPITGALLFFSTKPGISTLNNITKGAIFFGSWQLTLSLFSFIIFIIIAMFYAINKKSISIFELVAVFILIILFCVILFLPEQNMFLYEGTKYNFNTANQLSGNGIFWAVIFNLAIFFELLGLIFSGYLRHKKWLINLGTFFLFLLIIIKYFDWFFTFLDKSIFFIGAGILLFSVGWFMEKGRRYMFANIKNESHE